jgi:hypothetical protein
MSDIELPGTPNERKDTGWLTDGEKAVAVEAVQRLLTFLFANGKAVSTIRYLVMYVCGRETVVSSDTLTQTAAGLVGAATLAWSLWERHQQAHKATSAKPLPTVQEIKQT